MIRFSPILCHWGTQLNPIKISYLCKLGSHPDLSAFSPRDFSVDPMRLVHPTTDLVSLKLEQLKPNKIYNTTYFYSVWTFASVLVYLHGD